MAKRRPKKRAYKLINFKAYYDTDQAILDWWEGIESGERSDVLRDLIREQLGQPSQRKSKRSQLGGIDVSELLEVRRDTLWIKDALNDMPGYLERLMGDVVAALPRVIQTAPASATDQQPNSPSLTDAETQRRTRKMRKATW